MFSIGLPGSDAPLKLVVDSVYPLEKTEDAYARQKANLNVGKIVITIKNTTSGEAAPEPQRIVCGGVRPNESPATPEIQVRESFL